MTGRRSSLRILVGGVAVVSLVAMAAGGLSLWSTANAAGVSGARLLRGVSWRSRIAFIKATGGLPGLSISELVWMARQTGGFGLEAVADGVSAEGAVRNPHETDGDLAAARALYLRRCAGCHGADGNGTHGATLSQPSLRHGDSDLAIYKVIRDGIPGTAMPAAAVSFDELWQLTSFVRTLQLHAGIRSEPAMSLDVRVEPGDITVGGSNENAWTTYSGSVDGWRYTPLSEINPGNVAQLKMRWVQQFDTDESTEATPLVVAGTIFTTVPPATVLALDARSGKKLWQHTRGLPGDLALCCRRANRGVAILGRVLYWTSLDGYLVALDANTGRTLWETRVADPSLGFTMTGAPLIAKRRVVVGVAGGEFGIRGFLAAYDVDTGQQVWRFDTIPGPGERGHETWENDAWRSGGGATWITGSYDPELDLLYWGVGNPSPDFNRDVRPGDNLYTNSVVALRLSSGTLAWHFQFTPHDDHDWDSNQTPVLTEVSIGGALRKTISWPNRNGFYYLLDRLTGQFLVGVPFVEQNWATGLNADGRPLPVEGGVSASGRLTRPGPNGGANWQNAAFDPARETIFVHATEGASVFTKAAAPERRNGAQFLGSSAGSMAEPLRPVVRALNAATGVRIWERHSPPILEPTYAYSGLLATGGGLVFGASGGSVFAVDSATGSELWRVGLGGDTRAAPIAIRLDNRQVLIVSGGRGLFMFGL